MSVRSSLPPSSSAGGGGENLYSLKWNHYQSYLTKGLAQLLNEEYSMTDVTLACEGQFIQAHKVALAVCSPFFKEYFKTYRMEKSGGLIVLANVKFKDLKNLIQFIYHGEVNVRNADLSSFLRTANDLKIEGLADATKPDEDDNSLTRPNPNELKVQPSTSSASDPPSAHRLPSTSSSQSTSNSGGGPPLKRSRLSAPPGHRTGSPISVQNQNLNLSNASSSLAANSSESTAAVPIVDHSQSTTDAVQLPHQDEYDPLGMEDEQEEEMISFDEVKSEPIAVYSLNDEEDNSLSHHGGDALSGSMGNESSGMMYQDFNTSMSQQSAPGPSRASFQAHHRMQPGPSGPKPPAKPSVNDESLEGSGSVMSFQEVIDVYLMKCKKCGEGVTQEQFQTHACVRAANEKTGKVEPVNCPNCGKTFKNKNSLKVHKSTYHRSDRTSSSKVSSGTRLSSLVELDYISVPMPVSTSTNEPKHSPTVVVGANVTDPSQFVEVKLDQTHLQAQRSDPNIQLGNRYILSISSPRIEPKKEEPEVPQLQSHEQLLHDHSRAPVFFGDLDELDSLQAEQQHQHSEPNRTYKPAQ